MIQTCFAAKLLLCVSLSSAMLDVFASHFADDYIPLCFIFDSFIKFLH